MIKFWKSGAKSKTGHSVRPPESSATVFNDIKTLLNSQLVEEDEHYYMYGKKSKLSLSLHEILIERTAIQYFIQFMESIDKHILVKCWLDLDNFKANVKNNINESGTKNYTKINKTKSFELNCNSNENKKESYRFSWREGDGFIPNPSQANSYNQSSTSSCGNLTTHTFSELKDYQHTNLTDEAISLFKKYIALEASHPLDLPDSCRKLVISNICHPDGQIKKDCFKSVQDILFNEIENKYYHDFLNSPLYIKAQIDILTSGSLTLIDILYNETLLFYFTEYLEQESSRVLLEFLMASIHFRDNVINGNSESSEQIQNDAIVIYDKYFSLQATSPIGFSTEIRLKIESEICRECGPLPNCFDLPHQIVYKTLTHYLKTFLESELYYKYLSEMVHSVDHNWSSKYKSHSDCSSEFSISTQNTLLAMGDTAFTKNRRNHSVPDMTIDSNQLYNADSLWQRSRHEGLSLGRVNSLGRFESKFEPDPDKKRKSVFKKFVSRFVPSSSNKVEEEMAWQVAHMIVKDVTDLTMAPPENDLEEL